MTWLLQPPPLLAVGVVLAVAALVVERGVGLRRLFAALASAARAREEAEVWGTPDPAPPAKQPLDYSRLAKPIGPVVPAPTGDAPPVEAAAPAYSRSIVRTQPLLEGPPAPTRPHERRPEAESEPDEVSLADIFTRAQRRREESQEPES